jgi:hypothetical protein
MTGKHGFSLGSVVESTGLSFIDDNMNDECGIKPQKFLNTLAKKYPVKFAGG